MNPQTTLQELENATKAVTAHFGSELQKLRTGRAHPSMIEDVLVEAYGVQSPLKTLATITTPEPQLLQVSPFDPSTMQGIAQSIRANQSLGLNPVDDGRVIRIQIPPLTTERRQQIAKQVGEKQEEAMIGIRKARHEALAIVDRAKKAKEMSEDEAKRFEKQIDERVNATKVEVEQLAAAKEAELMKV